MHTNGLIRGRMYVIDYCEEWVGYEYLFGSTITLFYPAHEKFFEEALKRPCWRVIATTHRRGGSNVALLGIPSVRLL